MEADTDDLAFFRGLRNAIVLTVDGLALLALLAVGIAGWIATP